MKFQTYSRKEVDLFQHCLEQKAKFGRDLLVFIGTDSISVGGQCHYFTVIAFRYGNNGAHIIFSKCKFPVQRKENGRPDIFSKLWKEVELTIEVANSLCDNKIFQKDELILEFDFNGLVKTVSTELVAAAKGYSMQKGYYQSLSKCQTQARVTDPDKLEFVEIFYQDEIIKIFEQVAVKAANHLCQGI